MLILSWTINQQGHKWSVKSHTSRLIVGFHTVSKCIRNKKSFSTIVS